MYPSIMLTWRIGSRREPLGVTLPLLRTFTERRLDARQKTAGQSGRKGYWYGIQASFKVLINSFYGNLGYSRAIFNDFEAAEEVTLRGQEIIKPVVRELEATGAMPIEVDTDGVYFVPPPNRPPERSRAEEAFLARIGATLPTGIALAYDGSYAGMVSLKMKNYALIDREGHTILKGSSLRSRREEPLMRAVHAASDQALCRRFEGGRTRPLFPTSPNESSARTITLVRSADGRR